MTPYQQGFITKCAERGLTVKQAQSLLDTIASNPYYSAGIGALGGGALAGLGTAAFGKRDPDTKKKKYLRNILIGGGLGGLGGAGSSLLYSGHKIRRALQETYRKMVRDAEELQRKRELGWEPNPNPARASAAAEAGARSSGAISPSGVARTPEQTEIERARARGQTVVTNAPAENGSRAFTAEAPDQWNVMGDSPEEVMDAQRRAGGIDYAQPISPGKRSW